jgi:transcription termination/antitermination protein NusA
MDMSNLTSVLDQVSKDKGIERRILVEALEAAMLTAARKAYGLTKDFETHFNDENGDLEVFEFRTVVDTVTDPSTEILVEQARNLDPDCQPGDSLGMRIEKAELGRIAAQTAKQVIIQRVREAERENVYAEYADRKDELVTGVVRRFERGSIVVDLGRAEAILPLREQCPRESYRVNDRIQAYVADVSKQARGSQILLSRTSPGLLVKLFEMEVPEIYEGIVKIEAAAREPGARSKIAVSSSDRDVDPVGACVGMKGSRVQAVVQELRGEKVDIVPFDPDPARFVCNALAPAEVSRVLMDESNRSMEIIVPDDQLSLAIGRRGQNVRLASQLSGWRLDIVSEAKVKEIKDRSFKSLGRIPGVNDIHMQTLYNFGIRCAEDIQKAEERFLAGIPGIGEAMAKRIKDDAMRVVVEEKEEVVTERKEQVAQAREEARDMFDAVRRRLEHMSDYDRLIRVKGVGESLVPKLEQANIHAVEHLADLVDVRPVCEATGLSAEAVDQLHHAARVYLAKEARNESVEPSSEGAGPEEGYEPSALIKKTEENAEEVPAESI